MKPRYIILICVVVGVALLSAVGAAFRGGLAGLRGKAEPTAVRVERASRGPLVEIVSVPGEIQPETKVQISARVPAQILDLPHKEGEVVVGFDPKTAGSGARPPPEAVLVRLDARDLESSLTSAEARTAAQEAEIDVARARVEASRATIAATTATMADAERELRRQESLLETKDVSQQAVDQARTKVEELRNNLQAARHNLTADEQNLVVLGHNIDAAKAEINKAREQLAYTIITSPVGGTVIKVNNKVGETVVPGIQGNAGSVILEVADLSRMLVIGRVDEASVASVRAGQAAKVRMQAYRDKVFEGTVLSVGLARADAQTAAAQMRGGGGGEAGNWFEVRILLTNTAAQTGGRPIFTGLSADADIETSRKEGIRVPSQAVLGRPVEGLPAAVRNLPEVEKGKQFASVVYRYVDGKAVATPVKVGPSDETHTLVVSGLGEGATVITGPYKILDGLQDGQAVKMEGAAAASQPTSQPATQPAVTQPATVPASRPAAEIPNLKNKSQKTNHKQLRRPKSQWPERPPGGGNRLGPVYF